MIAVKKFKLASLFCMKCQATSHIQLQTKKLSQNIPFHTLPSTTVKQNENHHHLNLLQRTFSTAGITRNPSTQLNALQLQSRFQQKILCRKQSTDTYGVNDEKSNGSSKNDEGQKKKGRFANFTGKNSWKGGVLFLGVWMSTTAAVVVKLYGAPERDEDGQVIPDAYSEDNVLKAYPMRAWNSCRDFFQMMRDPTSEKLLPDPLKPPYIQPPYTLVLELTDLLLKPEWDIKMGWRFKKRPGLDYFLQQCAQNGYEIVIFSVESAQVGFPLTISMDPQGAIWYRLFKEDTRYTKGVHIKDLNCLNRDLSRTILIDVNSQTYKLNPRNGMALKKWNGKDDDRELYDLAAFLHTVAANKVEDVRSVVQYYSQYDDPMEKFRENQAELEKNQREIAQIMEKDAKSQLTKKSPFIKPRL